MSSEEYKKIRELYKQMTTGTSKERLEAAERLLELLPVPQDVEIGVEHE